MILIEIILYIFWLIWNIITTINVRDKLLTMSDKENNISAVRLGDKLIIFLNGQRQVISKTMSPEIFDIVCGYVDRNETDNIANIFDNFEDKLSKYLSEYFELEEGKLVDNFHKKPNHFSKLLIRKGTELMSSNEEVRPLFKLSKKIFFASQNIEENSNKTFDKTSFIGITSNGNLLLPIENLSTCDNRIIGRPVSIKEGSREVRNNVVLSLSLHKKDSKEEANIYALISPFDIISFNANNINTTRYKLYKRGEFNNVKGVVDVPNENLFEISYNIFEKEFKNN